MEEWKEHPSYECILVSNFGNIKSKITNNLYTQRLRRDGYQDASIYLGRNLGKKRRALVLVHRLVAQTFLPNPNNLPFIDHINRDKTDNNVENLKWASRSTNNHNRIFKKTSIYKGVSWNKTFEKWQSAVQRNKKRYHCGYFDDEHEAAEAYNSKAIELYGDNASLNTIRKM